MDEEVLRAMQRWPNVPAVYGWLALDRRGTWLIKTAAGRFEPVVNAAMREFIGHNYAHDQEGRWFFQNGPQRVFVALDYTPWVYRLDDAASGLVTQTGIKPRELRTMLVDDGGAILFDTELGVGVLLDRDLQPLLARMAGLKGENPDSVLEAVAQGGAVLGCRLFGAIIAVAPIGAADVPRRFHFIAHPAPPAGRPEC